MKERLLNGEDIDLSNGKDCVSIWFRQETEVFCLMLNGKVIQRTKHWTQIKKKILNIRGLKETK